MLQLNRAVRPAAVVAAAGLAIVLLGAVLPAGAPSGVLVLGVALGGLQALTAVGLVLIYRAAKIINFAQTAMGGVAAAFAVVMVSGWGVGYVVALLAGLVVAVATGAVVELVVVRRFWSRSRLVFTVATIGVGLILGSLQVALPGWVSNLGPTDGFTVPFDFTRTIGPVVITGDHLVALVVVPVVLLGLWLFLERTRVGAGIRAMADAPDRARLLGVPLGRLSLAVWIIAAVLSGLTAMLSVPLVGANLGSADAPQLLLVPLTAAVVGGMERIGVAAIAAVGIGVIDQIVYWNYPRSSTVDVVLFAVVLLALLIRRRGPAGRSEAGSDHIALAPRPLSPIARALPEVRVARVVLWVVLLLVAVAVPALLDNAQLVFGSNLAIYGILAISLAVLTGWAGLISLGQFAFAGIGAAASAYVLVTLRLDVLIALPVGMVVGALAAAAVGIPAIRFRSLFFAVTTFALAVPVSTWLLNPTEFPALTPAFIDRPYVAGRWSLESPLSYYYFCLLALALVIVAQRNLRRARSGRAILATRDNPRLAAAMTVSPPGSLLTAMMISGAMAGLAGGLWVIGLRSLPFNSFSLEGSIDLFTMVVIGGVGSTVGVLLGAAYVWSVEFFLEGPAQLFASGAGMLVLLMVLPQGLGGTLFAARDRLIAYLLARRGLTEPDPASGLVDADDAEGAVAPEPRADPIGTSANRPEPVSGALVARSIVAGYGHLPVLRSVDVSVAPGEIVALTGPNGAGKTTLLRVISGLLPAGEGHLASGTRSLDTLSVANRVKGGVATVFGGEAIFSSLTVSENIRMANWLRRAEPAQEEEVWQLFPELSVRASSRADSLSGGEKQMLAIAQVILTRPRFLLIDELTLGLSPARVRTLKQVIRQIADTGTGVLVVEQSPQVIDDIADRVLRMERGVLRDASGSTDLNGADRVKVRAPGPPPDVPREFRDIPAVGSASVPPAEVSVPALAIRAVSVHFGGVQALRNVSLELGRGEILGVIGSNGAGKTTLLDACSGYIPVDEGRIELAGHDITKSSATRRSARSLGRVFQSAMLYPSMTVSEVLSVARDRFIAVRDPLLCALRLPNVVASEEDVARYVNGVLEESGLIRYRDTLLDDLSLGVRRQVQLWAALAHEPSVLLLDEPSAGLPADSAAEMGTLIAQLPAARGVSILIIEHDVPLIASVADRLVAMHQGEVLTEGSPEEVLAHERVADTYFGAPIPRTPMVECEAPFPQEPRAAAVRRQQFLGSPVTAVEPRSRA